MNKIKSILKRCAVYLLTLVTVFTSINFSGIQMLSNVVDAYAATTTVNNNTQCSTYDGKSDSSRDSYINNAINNISWASGSGKNLQLGVTAEKNNACNNRVRVYNSPISLTGGKLYKITVSGRVKIQNGDTHYSAIGLGWGNGSNSGHTMSNGNISSYTSVTHTTDTFRPSANTTIYPVAIFHIQGTDSKSQTFTGEIESITMTIDEIHEHSYTTYVSTPKSPNCIENGYAVYKCSCGQTTNITLPKNGLHSHAT